MIECLKETDQISNGDVKLPSSAGDTAQGIGTVAVPSKVEFEVPSTDQGTHMYVRMHVCNTYVCMYTARCLKLQGLLLVDFTEMTTVFPQLVPHVVLFEYKQH